MTSGKSIRAARTSEVERIRQIERRSATRFGDTAYPDIVNDEPTDAKTLATRISDAGLIVAESDGEPVAFLMFRPLEHGAYIEQVDVLPEHAGQRLGAALIEETARIARDRGWRALMLSTFRDIPWNAPYYRRLGFVDLAEAELSPGLREIREEHLRRGLDESRRVFMRRPLQAPIPAP